MDYKTLKAKIEKAYKKTGLKPHDRRFHNPFTGEACPIGALLIAKYGTLPDEMLVSAARILKITESQAWDLAYGFDCTYDISKMKIRPAFKQGMKLRKDFPPCQQ